ncbi:hypothetical protein CHS0354_010573 [Potamilus streckersoni]|uniref:C-type lectin domain-containing protein n=1 Tax=Potamilus streckersoni TaxID=2493646 RepID=A0AAE0VPU5_9BIVA|nr:hypothetical protein CHS0354_010573 [Potamilus streckersoni]
MSMCKRPAFLSAACDNGWELDPNTRECFKFGNEKKTWNGSRAACQKLGGDLATVKSPDEQMYIYNRVRRITGSRGCWIGASDTTTENIWKGVDGSPIIYTDWGQDEPNNLYAADNCASISLGPSPNQGRWNDQNCTLMFPYVCRKSVSDLIPSSRTMTASTLTAITKEVETPEDKDYSDYDHLPPTTMAWESPCGYMLEPIHFEEFCYEINDLLATWQDARTRCQRDGGDLLSITTKNEQLYIEGRLKSRMLRNYWIGANDHGTEGRWKWSNGDPYFYFNWDSGRNYTFI